MAPAAEQDPDTAHAEAVLLVAEAVGELMRFWNFKPSMGRIWVVLYLSAEPLSAEEIEALSGLSSGNVSMNLAELSQWGVVQRVLGAGSRKRVYAAETDILKLVSRVFRERELRLVDQCVGQLERAVELLNVGSNNPKVMMRSRFQLTRVQRLLQLARVGRGLVQRLADTGQVDLGLLRR